MKSGKEVSRMTKTLLLEEEERLELRRALEVFEEELRTERVRSDDREVKASIREEEDLVKKILRKVA